MSGLDRLERDLDEVGRAIEDTSAATRDASEAIATKTSDEAPVRTGFLAGSVVVDEAGVGVGAPYAGFVHDDNPFAERAVDTVDWLAPFVDLVDDALDHLHHTYI